MASVIMHLAVAKELKNKFNIKNLKEYYLGSIAPDIAKHLDKNKTSTHFKNIGDLYCDIESFKKSYPNYKENDFLLGYYVHLFTDNIWVRDVYLNFYKDGEIKLLSNITVKPNFEDRKKMVYDDFMSLSEEVIDLYELDLSLFYENYEIPNITMNEFPIDKLKILTRNMGDLISQCEDKEEYIFNIDIVEKFVNQCKKEIEL